MTNARDLAAGHVDGDGTVDLVVVAHDNRFHTVGFGDRRGGIAFEAMVTLPPEPLGSHAVADFDGDGVLDEAVSSFLVLGKPFTGDVSVQLAFGCGRESLFRRGDTNSDGSVNIGDATAILAHLFAGAGELRCPDAADTNDSGRVEISDAVALLEHLFQSGADPAPPGPMTCGVDPSADDLAPCDASCF